MDDQFSFLVESNTRRSHLFLPFLAAKWRGNVHMERSAQVGLSSRFRSDTQRAVRSSLLLEAILESADWHENWVLQYLPQQRGPNWLYRLTKKDRGIHALFLPYASCLKGILIPLLSLSTCGHKRQVKSCLVNSHPSPYPLEEYFGQEILLPQSAHLPKWSGQI